MEDNDLLDLGFGDQKERELLSVNNFIILFFLTMGLYGVWWMYKSWRYFREKENLDIMPAMRAIFAIFFLYGLFERIQDLALSRGYTKRYSSSALFVGFVALNLLAQLPDPMWVISTLAFLCLIPPFKAFNFAMTRSDDFRAFEKENFNQRQIMLVVIGTFLWFLVIIGLVAGA